MPDQHASLREAQIAVMRDVSYVKRERSEDLGYSILTEQAAIAVIRPAMIEHGIVMFPIAATISKVDEYPTRSGGRMGRILGTRTFRFQHVGSGDFADVVVIAEGADGGDKAAGKLCTYGKKTALREFFCLETGNDETSVIEQRGADNERLFKRAITKIKTARTPEEADQFLTAIVGTKKAEWTQDQLASLRDFRDQHIDWLSAKETAPDKPTKNQAAKM